MNTWRRRDTRSAAPRVLIIVQNLPVPFDRRVWLECQALVGAGLRRHGDLPARARRPRTYEVLDGVAILQVPAVRAREAGRAGFVVEYAWSFLATARLALQARRRRGRFDVHPGLQPAGHLLAARPAGCGCVTAPGSCSTTTTSAPSSTSRASRTERGCRCAACWPSSGPPSAPPTTW